MEESKGIGDGVKLSIVIPTYNGEKYIHKPFDSIIPQLTGIEDLVEIVISDNASTDKTEEVVQEYIKRYPNVRIGYSRNAENLGPDKNAQIVIERSEGEYFWFFSDDDSIKEGGIRKVLEVIEEHPELATVFVNYRGDSPLKLKGDVLCKNGNEFFDVTCFKSGLMSSNVIKKSIWTSVDSSKYAKSNWIHIGVLTEALVDKPCYVISTPYLVQGVVEEVGKRWGKQASTAIGLRYARIIKGMNKEFYEPRVIKKGINTIRGSHFLDLPLAKAMGLKVDRQLLKDFYELYSDLPEFWLLDLPILLTPGIFFKAAYMAVYPARKKIKRFFFENNAENNG